MLIRFREDDDFFRRMVFAAVPKKHAMSSLKLFPLEALAMSRLFIGLHHHLINLHPMLMRMI